jgi:threonine dehydratase
VTCVMPTVAPLTKVDKCRKFGANVVIVGEHIGQSREIAMNDEKYKVRVASPERWIALHVMTDPQNAVLAVMCMHAGSSVYQRL